MLYDFVEIDTHTTKLSGILDSMDQNQARLKSIHQDLLNCGFFGSAAEGYDTITTTLNTKLTEYGASLGQLRIAIVKAGDLMHHTDTNNGAGFAGII